jgi:phenylpyruvate tautomerase PptA (4-oxalocrotonate tautomerase family)
MPYVNIKITRAACPERPQGSRRGATAKQKADPIGGLPVTQFRAAQAARATSQ